MRSPLLALIVLSVAACNRVDPPAQDVPGASASAAASAIVLVPLTPTAATPEATTTCNLESIAGHQIVDSEPVRVTGRVIGVSGWVVDEAAKLAPGEVSLHARQVEGEGAIWRAVIPVSTPRPDVQSARGGSAGLLNSGFLATLDASSLPAGRYAITLQFGNAAGGDLVCDNGRTIELQ